MQNGYYLTGHIDELTPSETCRLIEYGKKLKYATVFLDVGGRQDKYREQAIIYPKINDNTPTQEDKIARRQLFRAVEREIAKFEPYYSIREATFMRSNPGGENQESHTDMGSAEVDSQEFVPLVILVAIMGGTKLRVFPGVFGTDEDSNSIVGDKHKDIELNEGQAIVFRGDLAHCGLGYARLNYRIHLTLRAARPSENNTAAAAASSSSSDDDEEATSGNVTHPVRKGHFTCGGCRAPIKTKDALAKHKKFNCPVLADPEIQRKLKEKRDARNQVPSRCEYCEGEEVIYGNRLSLRKHLNRKHNIKLNNKGEVINVTEDPPAEGKTKGGGGDKMRMKKKQKRS